MSTKEMYRNIPAVIEKIHFLAESCVVEIGTPTKKPMRAVREENRLESSALQYPIPLLIRTAKSPTKRREVRTG